MIVEDKTDRQLKYRENKLLKEDLLTLEDLVRDKFRRRKPLQGLMFIINQQYKRDTLYPTSEEVQCDHGCRRSTGDLFLLMRYYYPDITFKEVRQLLFDLINSKKLNTSYCGWINKRVFWKEFGRYKEWTPGHVDGRFRKDEFGWELNIIE